MSMIYCHKYHIDEGKITYSNLQKKKPQVVTITALTPYGEITSKQFTFVSKYSEISL